MTNEDCFEDWFFPPVSENRLGGLVLSSSFLQASTMESMTAAVTASVAADTPKGPLVWWWRKGLEHLMCVGRVYIGTIGVDSDCGRLQRIKMCHFLCAILTH